MKIGIDVRQISHSKKHGRRTYVENLVKALLELDTSNEYVLYLDNKDSFFLPCVAQNITIRMLPWHVRYLSTLLNDHFVIPAHLQRDSLDLMHYPANPVNIGQLHASISTVLTVHDALPFFRRTDSIIKRGVINTFSNYYLSKLIKYSGKRMPTIITISETSKKDLVRFADISPSKITVVHEAANDNFRIIGDLTQLAIIKKKYNLSQEFILGFAHKNGTRIVEAYAKLPERLKSKCQVALIWLKNSFSEELQRIIRQRKLNKRIICIPPVWENELVLLYNGASLFVFPSFYEGFGLPVLEAMKCGCPVICSNRGSLPEVAGNAPIFVEELDDVRVCVAELSRKIEIVLSDKTLQNQLIQKGLKQARKFSWEKTAIETLEVYREVYRKNHCCPGKFNKNSLTS